MAYTNALTTDGGPRPGRSHPFGTIAIVLWGIALTCPALGGMYAFDRIRILVLCGALLMIDIALAVLCSILWYADRHLTRPADGWRAGADYAYRCGWRDCAAEHAIRPGLRLVEPVPLADGHHAAAATLWRADRAQ